MNAGARLGAAVHGLATTSAILAAGLRATCEIMQVDYAAFWSGALPDAAPAGAEWVTSDPDQACPIEPPTSDGPTATDDTSIRVSHQVGDQLEAALFLRRSAGGGWSQAESAMAADCLERLWDTVERARQHRDLLLAAQHRTANTIALVRSLARRTADDTYELADFMMYFESRLGALGRGQNMVSRSSDGRVDLRGMLTDELAVMLARDGEHYRTDGPDVRLSVRMAPTLTMVFHELASSSVQFGALGDDDGQLDISWRVVPGAGGDRLEIDWREESPRADGVAEHAERAALHEYLGAAMGYEADAEVTWQTAPNGMQHCRILVPLNDSTKV